MARTTTSGEAFTADHANMMTGDYQTAGGSSNAFTVTINEIGSAYEEGDEALFKANHTITGAATLNVNSIGAKSIVKDHDTALNSGDIENGQIVHVVYDGTNFQMVSPPIRQAKTEVFNSNGTYNKPGSATAVLVQAWGGGGSGSYTDETAGSSVDTSSGAGGGEYKEKLFDAADVSDSESITIGDGGDGVSTVSEGNNGATTSFGSLLSASGGKKGTLAASDAPSGAGGNSAGLSDPLYGSSVTASNGNPGLYSASGGSPDSGSDRGKSGGNSVYGGAGSGGPSLSSDGPGGSSEFGGDGGKGTSTGDGGAVNGGDGSAPGGAGGGRRADSDDSTRSGHGAKGRVIVTTFF